MRSCNSLHDLSSFAAIILPIAFLKIDADATGGDPQGVQAEVEDIELTKPKHASRVLLGGTSRALAHAPATQ